MTMALIEYRCRECGNEFSRITSSTDPGDNAVHVCPACGMMAGRKWSGQSVRVDVKRGRCGNAADGYKGER